MSSMLILTRDRLQDLDSSESIHIGEHAAGYQRTSIQSDIAGFIKPFTPWVGVTRKDIREAGKDGGETGKDRVEVRKDREVTGKAKETSQQPYDHHQRGSSSSSSVFGRDAVMWTVGALLTQSVSLKPPRGVVKGLTGLWLLLSLILATVYRSNLKAMIILPKITLPFNNLEELNNAGLPVWVALDSVLSDMIYNSEPQSVLGRLNHTVYNYDMEYSIPDGIKGYLTGRHVMAIPLAPLTFLTHLDYTQTGRCKTYIMAETFIKNAQFVIYFRKGSQLKAQLDPVIRGFREFGIFNHLYHKFVSNASRCLDPIKAESGRALDLRDFYGVYSIYAGGMVMALWCFLVEALVGRSRLQGK
ncbi:hypothetical protein Pmani_004281 [Petrolisthes manimaculis]|uniref:Ionotropic glutamate receptor C-terminal domain-containing protein n=1 Tax=Petrolisthes manimaculis TaxID=1843537 RepID=A0AAE1UIN4_9EUCA|nr:hypothetical protein Pmani_004281 [Petrolisthes manimaculis]